MQSSFRFKQTIRNGFKVSRAAAPAVTMAAALTLSFSRGSQAGPASRTHPSRVAVNWSVQTVHPVDEHNLVEVVSQSQLGLTFENADSVKKLLIQADAFIRAHDGRHWPERLAYVEKCAEPTEGGNPFCAWELSHDRARLGALDLTQTTGLRKIQKQLQQDLRNKDIDQLSKYSLSQLMTVVQKIDQFEPLAEIARRVIADKACHGTALPTALGAKAEEFFPVPEWVALALQLYYHAADCGDDAAGLKARYRAALIEIWQKKCDRAESFLAAVESKTEIYSQRARAEYWRHYCAEQSGDDAVKNEVREALWRNYPLSFYNLLLNGADPRINDWLHQSKNLSIAFRSAMHSELNDLLRVVEALVLREKPRLAGEVVESTSGSLALLEPEVRLYLAGLMERHQQSIAKFKILAQLFQDSPRTLNQQSLRLFFPQAFTQHLKLTAARIDPLLVLSLIRQESAFDKLARSHVGARGLMQVMPATARSFASVSSNKLFDPGINISVGTSYLLHRMQYYNGDVELTLAAYNAGNARVDDWRKRYPTDNKILFIDLIPFQETRDYVSSILRNYYWYVKLYSQEDLSAAVSIESPGPVHAKLTAILSANASAASIQKLAQ